MENEGLSLSDKTLKYFQKVKKYFDQRDMIIFSSFNEAFKRDTAIKWTIQTSSWKQLSGYFCYVLELPKSMEKQTTLLQDFQVLRQLPLRLYDCHKRSLKHFEIEKRLDQSTISFNVSDTEGETLIVNLTPVIMKLDLESTHDDWHGLGQDARRRLTIDALNEFNNPKSPFDKKKTTQMTNISFTFIDTQTPELTYRFAKDILIPRVELLESNKLVPSTNIILHVDKGNQEFWFTQVLTKRQDYITLVKVFGRVKPRDERLKEKNWFTTQLSMSQLTKRKTEEEEKEVLGGATM